MRFLKSRILVAALLLIAATGALAQPALEKSVVDGWMKELSNWGRWGKTDQAGTFNLITNAKRKAAAGLVREGYSVSLSRAADTKPSADNASPFGRKMLSSGVTPNPMFAMDNYSTSYHGQSLTHLDSLSHMFYQGKVYNGYPQEQINNAGAGQLDVMAFQTGFFSRGILIDMPQLKGVKYLELSTPIYPADFDAWEKKTGIKIGAGDIVFVRTGRWVRRAEKGPWDIGQAAAGMHASCARWFKQRDVAVVGSDTRGELQPSGVKGVPFPLHQLLIVAMGTPMIDNCDLEALSAAAAQRKRWEFLITAAPLTVPGGTGSPLNPIAIF